MREKKRGVEGAQACLRRVLRLGAAAAVALALAGCGDMSLVDTLQRESPGKLRFSPGTALVPLKTPYTFSVMGGISPYSIVSEPITLTRVRENTWEFPAQASITGDWQDFRIEAADWAGNSASAVVRVYSGGPPELDVSEVTLPVGASWTFQASGGLPDYTWEVDGVLQLPDVSPSPNDSLEFAYTSPGTYVVVVFDSLGASHTATVDVVLNTIGEPLSITPLSAVVLPGGIIAFTALGGSGSYTFTAPDGGSIDNTNPATFIAPGSTGTYAVTVTDNGADPPATVSGEAVVTATGTMLVLSPSGPTVSAVGDEVQFSASGGSPPYTYSSNKPDYGDIDPDTGLYLQKDAGSAVVTVADSGGLKDNTLVKWKP